MDIRDHGGAFSGGKYRKGTEVNVEEDLTTVSIAGKIDFIYERQAKGLFATIHRAPDGFIYALAWLGGYAVVYKYDDQLNELSSKTFSWSISQSIIAAKAYGYAIYFTGYYGNVYKINLSTLTEEWIYTVGSSQAQGTGLDISADGTKIAVGYNGNFAQVSITLLNANGTLIWEKIGLATDRKTVAIDASGNVYLATLSNGSTVSWKFNPSGTIIWSQLKTPYGGYGISGVGVNRDTGKVYIFYGSGSTRPAEMNPTTGEVIKVSTNIYTAFSNFNGLNDILFDEQGALIIAGNTVNSSSSPSYIVRIKDTGSAFELVNADATFIDAIRGMFIDKTFIYVASNYRVGRSGRITNYLLK